MNKGRLNVVAEMHTEIERLRSAAAAEAVEVEALLREALAGVAECVNDPVCYDADEPLPDEDWCEYCELRHRIEAHLEKTKALAQCGCGRGHVQGRACTPERKREAVEQLLQAWEQCPTERLGQFVLNSSGDALVFSLEDDRLIAAMKARAK